MKNIMILSYEGNVGINNVPQNTKKEDLIEIARKVLQEKTERALTGLNNISYLTEKQRSEYVINLMDQGIDMTKDEDYIEVDYEDYK